MFVKIASVLIGTFILLQNVNGQSRTNGLFIRDELYATSAPSKDSSLVRPKPLVEPTNTFPLLGNFAKGPCFRRQAIVKPGVVPRPVYPQSDVQVANTNNCNTCACQCCSCGCSGNTNLNQHCTNCACGVIDASKAYEHACTCIKAAPIADPVSLAIAYKQCQNKYVQRIAEEKLNRGFIRIPVDQERTKPNECKNNPSEMNLYEMNGQPVELKASKNGHTSCDNLSEEAEEALLNLAISEEACEVPTVKRPSLVELGYVRAQTGSNSFVNIPSTLITNCAPAQTDSASGSIVDGFRAGNLVYKNVGKIEPIVKLPGETSCESREEADRSITIPTSTSPSKGDTAGLANTHHRGLKSPSSRRHPKSHVVT